MSQKYLGTGKDQGATKVTNVADPVNPQDAVTLAYLNAHPPAAATQRTVAFFLG